MKREEFIKDAETRALGYLRKWKENPEFREAVAKPNASRKQRAGAKSARNREEA